MRPLVEHETHGMTRTVASPRPFPGRLSRSTYRLAAMLDAEQDRWFLWVPVLFGLGVAGYFALPFEPLLWPQGPLLLAAVILYVALRDRGLAIVLAGGLLAFSAGLTAISLRTELVRAPVLSKPVSGVGIDGWVETIEPRPQRGERLTIRVKAVTGLPPELWPYRVRIRTSVVDDTLKPGDGIRFKANLNPPGGPTLPGDYDFSRSAWFQRLGAVGYTRDAVTRLDLGPPPLSLRWRAPIERLRQAIGQRIVAALPVESGAIATALITGERGGISDATNDAFRDSGLLHILSISGLHMVIMGGAVFVSVRFLLALVPRLALRYPIKKWAATAAALAALGYLLISGASFPTVRSYITISIMYLAVLLDRPAVALRNIALSAMTILLVWPESLIDVSFQMSYAAVVALVASYEVIHDREQQRVGERHERGMITQGARLVGGILLSTLIASIAVAPFAAYHFHKSQQYAMLANLVAIPICNLLVMPMALATLVLMPIGLEAWPLAGMDHGIRAMVWCATTVAALPGAVARIPAIPTVAFSLMVAGGLWLSLWRQRVRWLGVLPILVGLALAPFRTAPDALVARDGRLVAWRGEDRRLAAAGGSPTSFDLARWLEHDGDPRRPQEVLEVRPKGFTCDWSGCTMSLKGKRIAISRHPASLADDCRAADILIVSYVWPTALSCGAEATHEGPRTRPATKPIIDLAALDRGGAHALYIKPDGRIILDRVADWRGTRPWTERSDALPTGPGRRRTMGGTNMPDPKPGSVPAADDAPRNSNHPPRVPQPSDDDP